MGIWKAEWVRRSLNGCVNRVGGGYIHNYYLILPCLLYHSKKKVFHEMKENGTTSLESACALKKLLVCVATRPVFTKACSARPTMHVAWTSHRRHHPAITDPCTSFLVPLFWFRKILEGRVKEKAVSWPRPHHHARQTNRILSLKAMILWNVAHYAS